MFGLRTTVCGLGLILILITIGAGVAEVPGKINYQGRLTDPDTGKPLVGSHEMSFRLFDLPDGGAELWSEPQTVSVDTTGVFSVMLGSVNPVAVDFDGPVWLEIEVEGETLSPRREIVSVPFAFRSAESDHASDADSLGGYESETYIREGDTDVITEDMIVDGPGSGLDADMVDGFHADAFADTGHTHNAFADTGHTHDDRYYLQEELNTAGTINDGGNPVAWTKLKDVPSGFADGTDEEGAGDGHSLDAADGNPVDALYVDDSGRVGVGTTNPGRRLHVNGDVLADSLTLGTGSTDGCLRLKNSRTVNFTALLGNYPTYGGYLNLINEDNGYSHTIIQPDPHSGGGTMLSLNRNSTSIGLSFDGNHMGSQEPKLEIKGSGRSVVFDMGVSGDDAVQLPFSSISKVEIKGEAAVAQTDDDYYGSLSAGYNILRQIAFLAPDDGYVLAIGTCETYMLHSEGTLSSAFFGVSQESNTVPVGMRFRRLLAAPLEGGARQEVVTVQGVFEVSQGIDTIYFLGYEEGGIWSVDNVYLTIVFIPSSCAFFIPSGDGALSIDTSVLSQEGSGVAGVGAGAPEADLLAAGESAWDRQAEDVSVNSAASRIGRLEHKIAVMGAELEALKQEMAQ